MTNRVLPVLMVLVMLGSGMVSGVVGSVSPQDTDDTLTQPSVDTVEEQTNSQLDDSGDRSETVQSVGETLGSTETNTEDDPPTRRYTLINTSTGVSFALAPGEPLADLGVPAGEYLVRAYNHTDQGEQQVGSFTVSVAADGSVERTESESGWGVETASDGSSHVEVRPVVGFEHDPYPEGSTVNLSVSVVNTSGRVPTPVGNTAVNVTVTGPSGQVVTQQSVISNGSGTVVVPVNTSSLPNGQYTVDTSTAINATTDSTSFYVGPSVEVYPHFTDHVEVNHSAEVAVALTERGDPVTNETVNVTFSKPDGTSEVKTLTTGPDGFATFNFTPQQAGHYSIYPSDRPGGGTSLTAGDTLGQIRTNDGEYSTHMPAGENVSLTGFVTDNGTPAAGKDIVVRIYNTTDSWSGTPVTNITTTTNAYGQYAVSWDTPNVSGARYEARLFASDGTRIPNDGGRINLQGTSSGGGGSGSNVSLYTSLQTPTWEDIVAPGGTAEALVTATENGDPVENAEVAYVLLYGERAVAANGTVTTNASGQATISVDIGADAPDGEDLTLLTVATLNGTAVSSSDSGDLQRYRIDEDRLGTNQPGTTVGFKLTFTDARTGNGAEGVPMMLSAETMDALHGSVFGTGSNVSTASGDATVSVQLPDRATNEYLYGPLYPYFDGGFPTEPVDGYGISIGGVPDRELEAGETVTLNYTASAVGDTGAVVMLKTWDDGVDPTPFTARVTEGENVTFTVPTVANDTTYTLVVRAINATGTTAVAYDRVSVNGSGEAVDPDTLVVDADGSGDYASIQNAVDNASSGQTVEVRPGVYREEVTVDKEISLVAPDGATLNGSTFTDTYVAGIWLQASATVSGFTIENYPQGIGASEYDDDWVVRNTTLRNNTVGVRAPYSRGNWTVVNTRVVNSSVGVDAYYTYGNWSIENSTIRGSTASKEGYTGDAVPGTGVFALNTTGSWSIHKTKIVNNSGNGVNATFANPQGDARSNWWGDTSGPDADDCVGNVTCAEYLTSPPGESAPPLVVATDGSGDYTTIQHAVDNATAGRTIEVRSGVYRERVTLDKNVSVVAPDGATLNGSTFTGSSDAAFTFQAAAHVSGFTIEHYPNGIYAVYNNDDWVVTNTTLFNNTVGVYAFNAGGDWVVHNATIRGTSETVGIGAGSSSGDWVVSETRIVGHDRGIQASQTSGNWVVHDSVIRGMNGTTGIWTDYSYGHWTVVDTRIRNNSEGVSALGNGGNWSIYNSTVEGTTVAGVDDTGVTAVDTTGYWEIHDTAFRNNSKHGINATGANPEGDARFNWWGDAGGPDADDCIGNVTCAEPRSTPPEHDASPTFEVRNVTAPSSASVGDNVVVSATIVNTGNANGTQNVSFEYSGETFGSSVRPVSLEPGESIRIAFTFGGNVDTAVTYSTTVATQNDTATADLEFVDQQFTCGVSWGDPHFVTFDGVSYDFQGVGEFVLAREVNGTGEAMTIQVRQVPVEGSTSVSITNATATVVDGHRVEIDAGESTPLFIDGSPVSLASGENVSVGNGTVKRNGDTYTIVYPGEDDIANATDERIRVDVIGDRIDLEVCLDPDRTEDVKGLLGTPNGNSSDDLAFENGTALDRPVDTDVLYGAYRDDWRVSNNTSVFTYEGDRGPDFYYVPNFPEQIVTLDDLNDSVRERAEELAIEAGLEPGTPAFRDAVIDYALTGDSEYFASARVAATSNVSTDADELPAPVSAVELVPRNNTTAVSSTVTYDVVVTNAIAGVGAYNLTFSIGNETVGKIVAVTHAGNESLQSTEYSVNNTSVRMVGALADTADTGRVTVATVTVRATTTGETGLDLSVGALGNENGAEYNVTDVRDGRLNVTGIPRLLDSYSGPPTDPDGDGLYEDINGDGEVNIVDVQALYALHEDPTVRANVHAFDFNGDGSISILDVQAFYAQQEWRDQLSSG